MKKTVVVKAHRERLSPESLTACAALLQAGGVIVFPTDTVYGIGCNAFHLDAINRIYEIKGRSYSKPLPVLLGKPGHLPLVAHDVSAKAFPLIEAYWPGPLTLVVNTAPMALAASRGKNTIAVRVPDHGVIRQILSVTGLPLASTSANLSGKIPSRTFDDVKKAFFGRVDMIIDGGRCPLGRESSVVDVTHDSFLVLREGAISKRDLVKTMKLDGRLE